MRTPVGLFCCVWAVAAALPAAEPRPADRAASVARFENACRAVQVDLAVQVRSFTLPDHSPLPLAITFAPEDFPTGASREEQDAWRRNADYPVRAWKTHRLQWADFLADYDISYDSLYHHGQPDFEVFGRAAEIDSPATRAVGGRAKSSCPGNPSLGRGLRQPGHEDSAPATRCRDETARGSV
jgi:hypothetical protein